jgi:putative phosphoesterase
MRIGIISDTHGSLTAFEKALEYLGEIDLLIHAGDVLYHGPRNPLPEGYNPAGLAERLHQLKIPYILVKGNVDADVDDWVLPYPLPPYALVQDGGTRIIAYHGFQHSSEQERVAFAKRFGAKILISGHTHQPILSEIDGITLLNPGSVALPKQEPQEPTFALIEGSVMQIRSLEDGHTLLEKTS